MEPQHIVFGLFFVTIVIAIIMHFDIQRRRRQQQAHAVATINAIIDPHLAALSRAWSQGAIVGEFGEIDASGWHNKMHYFFNKVYGPQMAAHGYYTKDYRQMVDLIYAKLDAYEAALPLPDDDDLTYLSDPLEYERWCAAALRRQGWTSHTTKGSGDQGSDVIAEKDGYRIVIQCKLYTSPVGNKAVQEAYAGRQFENADAAYVVTNMEYTKSARALANRTGVILLHHDDLLDFAVT